MVSGYNELDDERLFMGESGGHHPWRYLNSRGAWEKPFHFQFYAKFRVSENQDVRSVKPDKNIPVLIFVGKSPDITRRVLEEIDVTGEFPSDLNFGTGIPQPQPAYARFVSDTEGLRTGRCPVLNYRYWPDMF